MTKYFLLFTLFLFTTLNVFPQNYKEVRIYLNSKSDIQTLMNAGMQFDHFNFNRNNSIDVFVDENDFSILQSTGFNHEVLIEDWFSHYANLPTMSEAEKNLELQKVEQDFGVTGFNYGSMGGFYTLAEVNAELDEMYNLFPNLITQKFSIGNTIEGRPIYMVKISDNPSVSESEPQVLYTALHHAREPQSMEQMIFFMFYLLENYGTDPEVTYLVNNRELYFVPVINADGYQYNYTTNPGGGGMWRKNRRLNTGGSYGVDLNRNYGPEPYWNSSYGGSSTTPSSDTYRGNAPFSEPETIALKNFLASKNFSNVLNYHTYGNYLIYPYGCFPWLTADSLTFSEFASDITAYNGYLAGTAMETVGYSVRGTSDDYAYDGDILANKGKIFAMTPEVGTTGFWPTQSEIIPLALENLQPNLYYAWVAGESIHLENANFSQQYFNPGDVVNMLPSFRNKGLSTGYNVGVTVNSLSGFATINSGSTAMDSIQARSSAQVTVPLTFTISPTAPAEEEIQLEFVISLNSSVVRKDTISLIIGTPVFVFADTTNNPPNLWTLTSNNSKFWEATTTSFHTAPNSYTDSKIGNYLSSAVVTMTLTNAINLTTYVNPRLIFWTKYDIESNWDYGQVDISSNNGTTWFPLQGQYTEPGVGSFQPNGEPLYDGIRTNWVREEISLASYKAAQNKIRFQLNADGYIERDGWYVDDIGIIIYQIIPVEMLTFSANVRSNTVELNWSTASEMNNRMFEIQRADGNAGQNNMNWITIGYVEGKGTTTERSDYSFTDKSPVSGVSYYRLKQIDFDGTFKILNAEMVEFSFVKEYSLEQNYPNPFNPSTVINYSIPVDGNVELVVYNILGSEVAVLVNEYKEAGNYSVEFSTEEIKNNLGSGIYIYKLKSGSFTQTRKMVVLK
ncbi:MAG: T9SS type A sorting domain-containing protein [bacterium]|nr:T9SS type A sorting domain-containing protein [bacterium]